MSYHKITDNVYIGSIMSLKADKSLNFVTHVLSVFSGGNFIDENLESTPLLKTVKHKRLEVEDMDDVNLMQYFPETNEFINNAVEQNGCVLVHCVAGISRSVTCVCAYLMQLNKWNPEETIEFVRSKRPVANPNSGFREQLECYYKCGYNVSEEMKPYREFLLTQKARNNTQSETLYQQTNSKSSMVVWRQLIPNILNRLNMNITPDEIRTVEVNNRKFTVMEPVKGETDLTSFKLNDIDINIDILRDVLSNAKTQNFTYRCKKCSTTLASSSSLRVHRPGEKKCQDYFFEPVEWMRSELEKGEIEGRLSCFKCDAKVGSYSWKGSPCTCGVWVTPSFKLGFAKVDRMGVIEKPML